jgi:hypothetical protein
MRSEYTCRLCGTTLVEISLVPRIYPLDPKTGELDTMAGADEAFWEAETVIGVGCQTSTCANWQGQFGIKAQPDGTMSIHQAPSREEVARKGDFLDEHVKVIRVL